MNYTYQIREDKASIEDNEEIIVYGIDAIDENNHIIMSIPNIFVKKAKAINLANICNRGKLSYIHLMDVIEDFLE